MSKDDSILSRRTRDDDNRNQCVTLRKHNNRSLSFISLSHSDNQSESATKFYNSFKADVGGGGGGGNVLTLT